jgi:hypothetical protein
MDGTLPGMQVLILHQILLVQTLKKHFMKNIKSITLISLLLWLGTLQTFAQSSLTVTSGTNIFISNGTLFSVDSLVLNPSADYTITGPNSETRNATIIHPSPNPYIQRAFHFSSTTPSFSGAISIYYRDAELNGLPENVLTLNVHNGVNWNAFTANVTRDAVNNVVTTSALSNINMNELTLAAAGGPLPVLFSLFNAVCVPAGVQLTWKTAQESNSGHFEVQRSADGTAWQSIESVTAAGNSSAERSYTVTDKNSLTNSFYRIVEYDRTGRSIISSVLRSSCTSAELFAVYPNPVRDVALININVTRASSVSLRLYDAKGALVKRVETILLIGVNQLQLDMKGLGAGWYNLSVQWGNTVKQSRIIKE